MVLMASPQLQTKKQILEIVIDLKGLISYPMTCCPKSSRAPHEQLQIASDVGVALGCSRGIGTRKDGKDGKERERESERE
jgi:hypothetical protein